MQFADQPSLTQLQQTFFCIVDNAPETNSFTSKRNEQIIIKHHNAMIPDFHFQIGLLNAWIGPVVSWLTVLFLLLINPKAIGRLMDMSWYSKSDKIASYTTLIIMIILMALSAGIPLHVDSLWFYPGISLFIFGIIFNLIALYNYGTTPANKAIVTGMYKISRNPLYLSWTIVLIGMTIASQSWLFFILSITYHIPNHYLILAEERYCIETYGQTYEDYKAKVPRYFLF